MFKKLRRIQFLLFFLTLISYQPISAQENTVLLTTLLDEISNKHKIFFTYDTNLLTNKRIQREGFVNLSLKQSIVLLQKLTSYYFDDLGNNYYVIYAKKYSKNQENTLKNLVSKTDYKRDSINQEERFIIKGIVLNSENTPINGATLQETETKIGVTTNKDGLFELATQKNATIIISHVGYASKIQTFNELKFYTITLESGQELDEIHIVGSRNQNRIANDTPVAIDFININQLATKSSQIEVNQLLQYAIPSFNATKQSGSDGADHIDPATLRGLGPDQTLVLINGKRRHQTSLINLYGTRGRGNSGTDLNTIPLAAIERIELLRDGASAQYGSDAIAGVINIVLKEATNTLSVSSTAGLFNATPRKTISNKTDGNTYKLALNYGAKISNAGFINFSTEILSSDNTLRLGTTEREKYGQAGVKNVSMFFNSQIPIHKNTQLYANGGFNYRSTEAYAFTRIPDSERNVIAIYENGFNPIIGSTIADNSLSIGFITKLKNWNIDINNTFGRNNFKYTIKNTLNATLEENSPTEFDAGGHQLIQNTTSLNFSKYFTEIAHGFNIALGLEYRLDKYDIFAGEEASYAAYDIYGNIVTGVTPSTNLTSLNGNPRPGGSQGFPGYSIENEVSKSRTNFSMYGDTEFDFSEKIMIGTALRYEFYSDFGSTINFKIASRYKLSSSVNLRSSFSTGFRAPSLAQIYYNLTFTNFIGNVPSESLLISNNSPIARSFNIEQLKEEKAKNASFGITAKLNSNFNLALDAYYVEVKDRIILSGNFNASDLDFGVDNVQFFANGVDTETLGLDIILNWKKTLANNGKIAIDITGNINHMNITSIHNKSLDKETFFGSRDQQFLLASAPKNKFNFGINYTHKKNTFSVNITRFSKMKLIDWQILQDISNFNNSETERLQAATDIYTAKIIVDLHFNRQLNDVLTLQFGANNLFNNYPTEQNNYTDSGGLWDATQMGSNGAFYYTKINLNL